MSFIYTAQIYGNSTNTDNEKSYSIIGNLLVWGLITGTLLSYTPQYYKIYKNRNTKGISESMIAFGIYSCLFNVLGTIQEDYQKLHDCKLNHNCYDMWIPIIQLISPLLCIIILYGFYLSNITGEYTLLKEKDQNKLVQIYLKRQAIYQRGRHNLIACASIVLISLTVNTLCNVDSIKKCGEVFNVISAIFSMIMWLPQIITTYKLKKDYSLSLIALSIHALGCFITVFYQSFIMHQQFLVIGNYIIGGLSEAFIVCMVIYYRKKNKTYNDELNKLNLSFMEEPVYTSSDYNNEELYGSKYAVTL